MTFSPHQIEQDLIAFSDLGTSPHVLSYATHADIDWSRNGIRYQASFRPAKGGTRVEVELQNGNLISYPEFLGSPMMADLRALAGKIVLLEGKNRMRSRRTVLNREVYAYDWYVDSRVAPIASPDQGLLASEALRAVVEGEESSVGTRVVFLTAHAGQGKSSVLQHFNVNQAERYQQNKSSRLSFYVDAQGRGLAQLNEAIALQLNELQFLLPHSAVPILVREGLVTLIVDGFDELIGSRGTYDDAFSSLSNFLDLLEGRGNFVAAARSSYFTQEYESRSTRATNVFSGIAYEMEHLELLAWNADEQERFVSSVLRDVGLQGSQAKAVEKKYTQVARQDSAGVLGRPLFCRDVAVMLASGGDASAVSGGGDDVVAVITSSILKREAAEKLLVDGRQVVDEGLLRRYFEELAGEMWQLETRELDLQTARALMQVILEEGAVGGEAAEVIPARVGFLALVADGRRPKSLEFEHEIFFAHFLAGALAETVMTSTTAAARATLSKAALDPDAANEVARRLRMSEDATAASVIERLSSLGAGRHPRETQIRRNCGALAAATLRHEGGRDIGGLDFRDISFIGEDLADVQLDRPRFARVQLSRVDLRGAVITGGTAEAVSFLEPLIDANSILALDGFDWARDLLGLRFADPDGSIRTIYDPIVIAQVMGTSGAEIAEAPVERFDVSPEVSELVQRLCHAYERVNPIGTRHDRYGQIFASGCWKVIRDSLLETGLMTEVQRQASGPAQKFYRKHFQPAELMAALVRVPDDPAIDEFWARVTN